MRRHKPVCKVGAALRESRRSQVIVRPGCTRRTRAFRSAANCDSSQRATSADRSDQHPDRGRGLQTSLANIEAVMIKRRLEETERAPAG